MNYFDYIWKLCIFALLTAIVLMMAGCTTVTYDRQSGQVKYQRVGGIEFRRMEIVRDGDDVLLQIEQYKTEPMAEIAGSVAEGVARGLKP